jgi:hypothetical protein
MARARIVLRLVVGGAVALASSALPAATHPDTAALQQASAPVLAADNVQRLCDENQGSGGDIATTASYQRPRGQDFLGVSGLNQY